MIARFVFGPGILTILASLILGATGLPARATTGTNAWQPLVPGSADGRIAFVAARMLEKLHYNHQAFRDAISSEFLDRYMESLDPQHLHFTQQDEEEFERYRNLLDNLTITNSGVADTRPAYQIYNRFMKRLEQRVAFAESYLKTNAFSFDADERILINRKEKPFPADLSEAETLWAERVRFEYLQERLGKIEAKKKAEKKPATAQAEKKEAKTEPEEIIDTLTHRYQRNLRMFRDWDSDDVLQLYVNTLAHVYDPHSDYYGKAQLEQFAIGMNLSLFGIGAELRFEDGYCTISRLLPGGPAIKSKKIKEKDRIVSVAQSNAPPVDIVEMNLTKAVQLIRGPKGTEVRLTVIPANADSSAREEIVLIRDEIPLEDQAAKAKVIDLPAVGGGDPVRVGVIDLPSFYAPFDTSSSNKRSEMKSTTADVSKLLTKLKQEKVQGLILDLRRNGGGSLDEAVRLTGIFIKQGPVVQVKDHAGVIQEESDKDPAVLYDGPLVVLTSRFSASASEIVAGALQDYGRAIVVGDASTHGKGTVQSVNPIKPYMQFGDVVLTNDPGALKLTIKKFYRASGSSTQLKGVVPDIVLPSVLNEGKDFGEAALENPLPWDTMPSAKFEPLNNVAPYLADLKQRSDKRVGEDKDFAYVREDVALYKKNQEEKTISLNEQQRLKEKSEADARQKAREDERLARKETTEKIYEVTLKNVDLPGLPPPVAKTNAVTKAAGSLPAAGGTNESASVGSGTGVPMSSADGEEEVKPAPTDTNLIEAQHILVDYLQLLAKRANLAGK